MQAILYINNSDNNKIDKDITTVRTIDVVLKDDTDNINPILIMSPSVAQTFNYVYIADFDRYYFVKSSTYSQQKYIVNLTVDVLMSFRSSIKNLTVIANRSSSRFDLYLPDPDLPVRADASVKTVPFYNGFTAEGNEQYILAVAGGYQPTTPTTDEGGE